MVIAALCVASSAAALSVAALVARWPAADPAATASDSVREGFQRPRDDGFRRARLDPDTLTGLALTVASLCVIVGGMIAGVLFFLIRSHARMLDVDARVAAWAATHASPATSVVLRAITQLGSTPFVVAAAAIVGFLELRRIRSRSLWLFLVLVVAGELVVVNLIKVGVDRARPALDPLAPFSGSSFPSGHTAAAAACYAALALVLSRGRTPRARAMLAGAAAGIAVAVGVSRMLLGVHWFTDVIAGLAVGWAWFAFCAIATGGSLLRFGEAVETGPDERDDGSPAETTAALRG